MANNFHTISYAAYLNLTCFITRYVQSIDPIDGTGIPGRKLVALCLEAEELPFGSEEEGNTREEGKKQVEEAIKKMVREGVLMPVQDHGNGSVNRGVGFRLGEGVKVAEIAGMRGAEDKENMVPRAEKGNSSKNFGSNASGNGYMGVILGEEEGESVESGRMKGNEEEYTQLRSFTPPAHSPTRLDEPTLLEESDPNTDPATPRNPKRRKRQNEVAESYASSRFDTVSPDRDYEVHDSPKREVKRIKGPCEESDLDADAEADVPIPSFEDHQRKLESDKYLENLDSNLVLMFKDFQTEFPGHEFEIHGDGFKCHECGRSLTANRHQFKRHLESKGHKDKMADIRRGRADENIGATFRPTSMRASMGSFSNYSNMAPPEPVQVYAANAGQMSRNQMGLAILQSLDADTNKNEIRITLLERRVSESDKKISNHVNGLTERIDGYDKRSAEEIAELNECVKTAQAETRSGMQDLSIEVADVERRTKDRLLGVEETVEKIKNADREYETSLLDMQKSLSDAEKKTDEITVGFRTKLANFAGRILKFEDDNKESMVGFTDRLGKVEKSERFKKLGERLDRYRGRIIDLEGEQSRQKISITGLEAQFENLTDVESNIQVLTGEIKRCRGNDGTTKEYNDHMEKEMKDLKEHVSALRILIEENQRGKEREVEMEKLTTERFAVMEKRMEEKITQTQQKYEKDMNNLVEVTWKQKDRLDEVEEDLQTQNTTIASQAGLIEAYAIQLKQRDEALRKSSIAYEEMLRKYDEQIALQNQIIKVQRSDLDYHTKNIKQQGKKLEEQAKWLEKQKKCTKHTDLIVNEFMKDVRMLDHKIDNHIDDVAEKEAAKEEKELQRKERLEEQKKEMAEEQKNRRRSSISRPALRRVSVNSRARVFHLSRNSRRTTIG